jgi:mono/diheme cytochrome c family protein
MARQRMIGVLFGIAAMCSLHARAETAAHAADGAVTIARFAKTACLDCHAGAAAEAGFDLESLLSTGSRAQAFDSLALARWERVFERVERGEMPPADADQPPPDDRHAFLAALATDLAVRSRAIQEAEGRTALRRLNRVEYEHTLRDLLALPVLAVRDLLPEDASTAGFDTVASGLGSSAEHLVRYQEAADRALLAAVPDRPIDPLHWSATGSEVFSWNSKQFQTWQCWLVDDGIAMPSRLWAPYVTVATPPAPADGRYRVRVLGNAINTDGRPVPVSFSIAPIESGEFENVLAWRDLPADAPKTIEVDLVLRRGQRVDVLGWTLPFRDTVRWKTQERTAEAQRFPAVVVRRLEIDGPVDTWPPASYRTLFGDLPLAPRSLAKAMAAGTPLPPVNEKRDAAAWTADPLVPVPIDARADAERLIRRFLPKAFRRPLPDSLLDAYVAEARATLAAGAPFHDAMRETYRSAICSPHFLFFAEQPGKLGGPALASRLAFFLWRGPPDDRLMAAATDGTLATSLGLRTQVERMLDDPRTERFVADFTGQWLDLRKIDDTTPDAKIYQEFDDVLQRSAVRETELFFAELLRCDGSVLDVVHSRWAMLNERLARHYDLFLEPAKGHEPPEKRTPLVLGGELRRTTLPPQSHRGGVITHASVLKVTADGTRTSPVVRGAWICSRILGVEPPAPPKNVPKIEPDIRGATTIREQLARHRSDASCASCHKLIDPPGFALETYDAIGGWRESYRTSAKPGHNAWLANYGRWVPRGPDIEQGDRMPDGRTFTDIDDYKRMVLEDPEAIVRNLAGKLVTFSTGAPVQFADRAEIDGIVSSLEPQGYGLRSLVHAVVQSRMFQEK